MDVQMADMEPAGGEPPPETLGTCRWPMHPDYMPDELHPKLETCSHWTPEPSPGTDPALATSRDTMYEFLVKVDSITSWVAHRVHRETLGAENERYLLAVSAEARRRYTEMKNSER